MYVMNCVEIVIAYYSHITSHIFQAFASYTHYTSYSLLNFVHVIVCDFVVAIQDYMFLDFDAKIEFWGKIGWKTCFWEIWVEFMCFWKTFNLILMHFIHEILCFEEILHKIALFFKNFIFLDFRSIESVSRPIEIAIKIFGLILSDSIGVRSMLDRSKLKNFQFLSFWPNFFSCIIYG